MNRRQDRCQGCGGEVDWKGRAVTDTTANIDVTATDTDHSVSCRCEGEGWSITGRQISEADRRAGERAAVLRHQIDRQRRQASLAGMLALNRRHRPRSVHMPTQRRRDWVRR